MKMLDLFAGIGGFSLAAHWLGWETVAFVEWDKFCQKVLTKNFPNIPIYGDIKEYEGKLGTADIICGGFPCQTVSLAGKRTGSKDTRWLWPEMLRVCKEIKSRYIVIENVAGIVSMELDTIIFDLENLQYKTWTFDISAYSVNLPTLERHIWIIAKAVGKRFKRCEEKKNKNNKYKRKFQRTNKGEFDRWDISKTQFCRVDQRLSGKLDKYQRERLIALGNAIIPKIAYEIFKVIDNNERTYSRIS